MGHLGSTYVESRKMMQTDVENKYMDTKVVRGIGRFRLTDIHF